MVTGAQRQHFVAQFDGIHCRLRPTELLSFSQGVAGVSVVSLKITISAFRNKAVCRIVEILR